MNKRLRRKKRVGEFKELAFETGFRFSDNLTDKEYDDFLDRFILEAVENNSLECGGGGDRREFTCFLCSSKKRQSANKEQQEILRQWYLSESLVLEFFINDFVDAWYDCKSENYNWIKK